MKKVVSLKMLSEKLGISISTVSRALSDHHEISDSTKKRVLAMAKKLGFVPNQHAATLRRKKSKTIAVILPEIQHSFFSQVISGIQKVALRKGFHVFIYLTNEDTVKEHEIIELLSNKRVDGMLISIAATTTDFSHFESARKKSVPIVFFDRSCEEIDVPHVITDNAEVSMKATLHLIKNECKRIAFLSMPSHLSIIQKRTAGYLAALRKHGLSSEQHIVECGLDTESNREIIKQVLLAGNPPDAIFASAERLALITYELCRDLQINIPTDLKIVSFSNFNATALFSPSLTTIMQPATQMGYDAASVLFKIIDNKMISSFEQEIVIPSQLIERVSSTSKMYTVLQ